MQSLMGQSTISCRIGLLGKNHVIWQVANVPILFLADAVLKNMRKEMEESRATSLLLPAATVSCHLKQGFCTFLF